MVHCIIKVSLDSIHICSGNDSTGESSYGYNGTCVNLVDAGGFFCVYVVLDGKPVDRVFIQGGRAREHLIGA